jgi:hypothetical protein
VKTLNGAPSSVRRLRRPASSGRARTLERTAKVENFDAVKNQDANVGGVTTTDHYTPVAG